jgi:hypothetical protein
MPTAIASKSFTFTVPEGWRADGGGAIKKNAAGPPFGGDDALFAAWNVTHVPRDACEWRSTMVEAGSTADELANLLAEQRGRETAGPTDMMVSGRDAKLVELGELASDDQTQCDDGFARVWPDTGGGESGGWPAAPGQTDRIYVVDVEGTRVVLIATTYPDTPAADVNELQAIVDSVRFQP